MLNITETASARSTLFRRYPTEADGMDGSRSRHRGARDSATRITHHGPGARAPVSMAGFYWRRIGRRGSARAVTEIGLKLDLAHRIPIHHILCHNPPMRNLTATPSLPVRSADKTKGRATFDHPRLIHWGRSVSQRSMLPMSLNKSYIYFLGLTYSVVGGKQ